MIKLELGENLRLLCSFEHSVSDACRSMNINRQQFSKYLSGDSKPSARNLNKICNYFKIRPADLFLPHNEFSECKPIEKRRSKLSTNSSGGPPYRKAFDGHSRDLNRYLGYYHYYFHSFGWEGLILCALTSVQNRDGQICTKTIERSHDPGSGALFLSKYDGQAAFLGSKIYIAEYQSLAKDAIVETVLSPAGRGELTYLSGVTFGISSRQGNPYMTRSVYHYLGDNIDLKSAMKSVGLIDPRAGKINPHVMHLLGEPDVRGAELNFD